MRLLNAGPRDSLQCSFAIVLMAFFKGDVLVKLFFDRNMLLSAPELVEIGRIVSNIVTIPEDNKC